MSISRSGLAAVAAMAALALVTAACAPASRPARKPPAAASQEAAEEATATAGAWLSGDMHTHTVLTDGSFSQAEVAMRAFETYGLDWMANAEHGGKATHDASGTPVTGTVWRWRSIIEQSWPAVLGARSRYPKRMIVQGLEWGVPGGDEAAIGIVSGEPTSVATFEFLFDRADESTLGPGGIRQQPPVALRATGAEGAAWLAKTYPLTSYLQVNHPSRTGPIAPASFRRFLDAAGEVAIGFEGIPGHQKAPLRGNYPGPPARPGSARVGGTYGGADPMLAKVGGFWDALLAEGRRFCVFANSDFHTSESDFWPGQYAASWTWVQAPRDYERLVGGLRSGRSFAVTGQLIDRLEFSASSGTSSAVMGDRALVVSPGSDVTVTVRFHSPDRNANGDVPKVDHVDLIGGRVGPRAAGDSAAYASDSSSATVLWTFTAQPPGIMIKDVGTGWYEVSWRLLDVRESRYLRLRGTNLPRGTPGQTDASGSPLPDAVPNSAAEAWADLWFYSNPLWIEVR